MSKVDPRYKRFTQLLKRFDYPTTVGMMKLDTKTAERFKNRYILGGGKL